MKVSSKMEVINRAWASSRVVLPNRRKALSLPIRELFPPAKITPLMGIFSGMRRPFQTRILPGRQKLLFNQGNKRNELREGKVRHMLYPLMVGTNSENIAHSSGKQSAQILV